MSAKSFIKSITFLKCFSRKIRYKSSQHSSIYDLPSNKCGSTLSPIHLKSLPVGTLRALRAFLLYNDILEEAAPKKIDSKFGHSFCNKNDFSDAYYYFYIQTLTINEIKRESDFRRKN